MRGDVVVPPQELDASQKQELDASQKQELDAQQTVATQGFSEEPSWGRELDGSGSVYSNGGHH